MGYVYVLADKETGSVIKIGRTSRHPAIRAREFNQVHPIKMGVYSYYWFNSDKNVERALHKILEGAGYMRRRELFRCPPTAADQILRSLRDKNF